MRMMVIGGGGQLGSKIVEQATDDMNVYATYQARKPSIDQSRIFQLDVRDPQATARVIQEVGPDVAIDTAALHNVDYCETHRDEAWAANVAGTRNVAEACHTFGVRMIFVSTDYVFDGTKGNYTEDDEANPVNYYGITKLEAEKAIARMCPNSAIARSSVVYSYGPTTRGQSSSGKPLNFAMWLTEQLGKHETVKVVADQYSSPTLADDLALALLKLAETERTGMYHAAGRTRLSRYELAVRVARKLDFDERSIVPISTSQLKQAAKRPPDSSLNVDKIERDLGLRLSSIDEALEKLRDQFVRAGGP